MREGRTMSAAKRSGVRMVMIINDFFLTLIRNSREIIRNSLLFFMTPP